MTNTPQDKKSQSQKSDLSNQSRAGKEESTAKSGKYNMKNEGGRNSTSGNKSSKA